MMMDWAGMGQALGQALTKESGRWAALSAVSALFGVGMAVAGGGTRQGPSRWVKSLCSAVSLGGILFCGERGSTFWAKARENGSGWPQHFGLLCGLGSVAVAQVAIIAVYFVRREQGVPVPFFFGKNYIQTRGPARKRSFAGDVVAHLSNVSAFLLLGVYLSATWMLNLMPESYYDFESPAQLWKVAASLFVVDAFTFVNHVAEHSFSRLYRISHKPHHRFVSPALLDAFDGSLIDTLGLILFPLFATAHLVSLNNMEYIIFGTVYSSHFAMIHSEYENPQLDWLFEKLYINTAQDHHVHHACFTSNFAHIFTVFDKLCFTYRHGSTCPGFTSAKGTDKNE
mmetsp:Transcript_5516/g.9928  ORF Transcript_5516/g.9928 Transcript_5516/m.9928 type:complete len:341 (-) Transcript_5516:31-1053(-)